MLYIILIVILAISLCIGYKIIKQRERTIIKLYDNVEKKNMLYKLCISWIDSLQKKENLEQWFLDRGYSRIAIYGMHYLGQKLYDQLENTNIEVVYGIDRNRKENYRDLKMVSLEQNWENVDVIVVTPIADFTEIKSSVEKKIECDVISLDELFD